MTSATDEGEILPIFTSVKIYRSIEESNFKNMNGLFFTDKINECLDSKAFIAHIAPVSDELDLFTKLSNALHFPDYFGKNWDALIDLYYEFHWILEKDIIIFHESLSGLSEQELKTYLQIVFIALDVWSDEKVHRISFVFSCQDEDKILRIIFDNSKPSHYSCLSLGPCQTGIFVRAIFHFAGADR